MTTITNLLERAKSAKLEEEQNQARLNEAEAQAKANELAAIIRENVNSDILDALNINLNKPFTGYRSTGGRGKAIFMLLVLAAVLGGGFLLAAALGALWAAVKGGL